MAITANQDRLGTIQEGSFSTSWDYKGSFVSKLKEDGLERFSQFSASPDATLLFAGPARFTGLGSGTVDLIPIGLVDNMSMQSDNGLMRLFEIGSARSFFVRGKQTHSISLSKLLADQSNILNALSKAAYRPNMAIDGSRAAGPTSPNADIMMNIDSEYFSVPFGLLLLMKTRGGNTDGYGKVLTALYLESCMFQNYSFSVASTQPVIAENVSIQYDRPVPVSFN